MNLILQIVLILIFAFITNFAIDFKPDIARVAYTIFGYAGCVILHWDKFSYKEKP